MEKIIDLLRSVVEDERNSDELRITAIKAIQALMGAPATIPQLQMAPSAAPTLDFLKQGPLASWVGPPPQDYPSGGTAAPPGELLAVPVLGGLPWEDMTNPQDAPPKE